MEHETSGGDFECARQRIWKASILSSIIRIYIGDPTHEADEQKTAGGGAMMIFGIVFLLIDADIVPVVKNLFGVTAQRTKPIW